jgi:hypothetical protein
VCLMVVFFPPSYPDEILYSLLSRYHHAYSGNTFTNTTLIDLFGKNTLSVNPWLQANLSLLAKNLPVMCTLTPERMIEDHSLLPVFAPFLPRERVDEIKQKMINFGLKSSTQVLQKLGAGGESYDSSLYYCKSCVEKDRREFGVAYWHRVHQIPGVLVCPDHGDLLTKYFPPISGGKLNFVHLDTLEFTIAQEEKEEFDEHTIDKLKDVARDLQWLLSFDFSPNSLDFYYRKYRNLLQLKGLATPAGKLRGARVLKNEVIDYFGIKTLELLGCGDIPDNPREKRNWLFEITRKSKFTFEPVQHVLISNFLLGDSIKKLFQKEYSFSLFGPGPWKCLNPIASHYNELCITKMEGHQKRTRLQKSVGIFHCSECGFIYSISGPINKDKGDENNTHKVIDFGWLWKEELNKLVNQKLSLSEISRKLDVGVNAIKKQAELLKLETNWKPLGKFEVEKITFEEKRKIYRKEWKKLVKENYEMNKTQLKKLSPSLSYWLYNYDREWYNENSPKKQINRKEIIYGSIVDWHKRDIELLDKVKNFLDNWNDSEKPIRKTIYRISKELNVPYLWYGTENLPLTMEYLKNELESIEDFQLRRIKKVICEIRNSNKSLTWWKVLDSARLNPHLITPKLKDIILREIDKEGL